MSTWLAIFAVANVIAWPICRRLDRNRKAGVYRRGFLKESVRRKTLDSDS